MQKQGKVKYGKTRLYKARQGKIRQDNRNKTLKALQGDVNKQDEVRWGRYTTIR